MSAPTPPPSSPPPGMAPQGGSGFNINAWNIFDKITLGAGALFFIFSLFGGFIHVSVNFAGFGGGSGTGGTAWHSYGALAVLLVLAGVVLVGLKAVGGLIPASVPTPLIAAGAIALGWILLVLRAFTGGGYPSGDGISVSPGWSAWVLFVIGLVAIAGAVIPLTGAAGNVEAKLNDAAGKFGNNG